MSEIWTVVGEDHQETGDGPADPIQMRAILDRDRNRAVVEIAVRGCAPVQLTPDDARRLAGALVGVASTAEIAWFSYAWGQEEEVPS